VLHGSLEDPADVRKVLDKLQISGDRLPEIHRFREKAADAGDRDPA